ncbi:receptor interacting protein kinase 1b [Apostichopus japonicus]|uniref:Receptor interacting protein kinase 1b n=1 Tax=Stichopus japonicus TaxID=307972 RepID=A0A2G8KTD6_STIJA|nr:receptor interacting protein kinase 1b [Apostichopus japonicus]
MAADMKIPDCIPDQDRRVVTDEDLQFISERVPREWKDLGRALGFTPAELDAIEIDNHGPTGGHKETVYKMLLKWQRKHGGNATVHALKQALNKAEMEGILL